MPDLDQSPDSGDQKIRAAGVETLVDQEIDLAEIDARLS